MSGAPGPQDKLETIKPVPFTAVHLADVLDTHGIPYVITTLSPENASDAESQGRRVLRADYTRSHNLAAFM